MDASPSVVDHYFSAAYLRVMSTKGLVIDAAGRSDNFLLSLIKRAYRPF